MQAIAQKFAMQAALVGSISAGSYVIRKFKKTETNEIIKGTTYLREQPELCYVLNGIYCLRNDEIFILIVNKLEELLFSINNKKNVWTINRNIKDVINLANLMKKKAVKTFDEELITYAIDYENEYFPSLKRQLDDILHNMLLDRIKS